MGLELPFGAVIRVQLRSVASQVEAGTVWINQHAIRNPFVPASAYKDLGLGVEYGQEGLEEFCNMQVIAERAGNSISS
ncbi:MAG: aldehyde dehydrogenase family protein [Chthoniobacterales bacterium]